MAKKRQGQWFGDAVLQTITAGSAEAQVIDILPPALSLESIRDLVFERAIIGFNTRRLNTTVVEGYGFVLWHGMINPATQVKSDPIDPNSLLSNVWADKRIMQVGRLHVPALQFDSTAQAAVVSQEVTAEEVDVGVKRSVNRGTEGVFLKVSTDVTSTVKCFITWRCYYTYA